MRVATAAPQKQKTDHLTRRVQKRVRSPNPAGLAAAPDEQNTTQIGDPSRRQQGGCHRITRVRWCQRHDDQR